MILWQELALPQQALSGRAFSPGPNLIMPEMGGIQLYQGLIRINPAVRVVVSNGLISGGTRRDAEKLGP